MKTPIFDRTGILILRVWIESTNQGLRARITHSLDSAGSEQTIATAATPEDIYTVVRTWVESFVNPN